MNTAPANDNDRWQLHAACRGHSDLFHANDQLSIEIACRVCRTCPVKAQCATLADQIETDTGGSLGAVWAGRRR